MPALSSTQRAALEKTVVLARQQAETGARNALRALAVDQPEPYAHTTPDQRALRNRLRAKARLLGDALQTTGHQDINHLAYELAYEYWHRMLFAKFLEANHLLIHSEGVAVTMEDCAELAPEEGYADKWTAAAAYASRMLPAIFLFTCSECNNDRHQPNRRPNFLISSTFHALCFHAKPKYLKDNNPV